MYKQDLALNNLEELIYHKTNQPICHLTINTWGVAHVTHKSIESMLALASCYTYI